MARRAIEWPGGPLLEGRRLDKFSHCMHHHMARRANVWPEGPTNYLCTGHKHCSVNVLWASEPCRRQGSEVLSVSVNPWGHVAKLPPYGGVRYYLKGQTETRLIAYSFSVFIFVTISGFSIFSSVLISFYFVESPLKPLFLMFFFTISGVGLPRVRYKTQF